MANFKIINLIFSLFLVLVQLAQAQLVNSEGKVNTSSPVKDFRLNFAVPESPAFKLLEVDQSKILRPASLRELGVALSEFTGTDNIALNIPKAFANRILPGSITQRK